MPTLEPSSSIPGAAAAELARFNHDWLKRRRAFAESAPPPWWAPGLELTPAVRQAYESYLPICDFLAGLARLGRAFLPHPSWLPAVLRTPQIREHGDAGPTSPLSLPDLWAELPPHLAGRTTFRPDERLAIFCALAAPARLGTAAGRYPEQTARLCAAASGLAEHPPLRMLDLGCGTGQGTWELAGTLAAATARPVAALGLTREPLEAWMAARRQTPHDPRRELAFPAVPACVCVHFVAGDMRRLPLRCGFHLIVANGIVGGPFLKEPGPVMRWLDAAGRLLLPGGRLSLANRFHEGSRRRIEALARRAAAAGWEVEGEPRLLWLRRRAPEPGG